MNDKAVIFLMLMLWIPGGILLVALLKILWDGLAIGTKSVLIGAHAFWLHPFFVARAWWILFGFPWDPRLWVAFFVHDLGYLGKPNMDGEEGERHPFFGAQLMGLLFDWPREFRRHKTIGVPYVLPKEWEGYPMFYNVEREEVIIKNRRWYYFTLLHSRFLSKALGLRTSQLCVADKLAIALEPSWLYLPRVNWTGEIHEYMKMAAVNSAGRMDVRDPRVKEAQKAWHRDVMVYVRGWVEAHKNGEDDTWTTTRGGAGGYENRTTTGETGVWK